MFTVDIAKERVVEENTVHAIRRSLKSRTEVMSTDSCYFFIRSINNGVGALSYPSQHYLALLGIYINTCPADGRKAALATPSQIGLLPFVFISANGRTRKKKVR